MIWYVAAVFLIFAVVTVVGVYRTWRDDEDALIAMLSEKGLRRGSFGYRAMLVPLAWAIVTFVGAAGAIALLLGTTLDLKLLSWLGVLLFLLWLGMAGIATYAMYSGRPGFLLHPALRRTPGAWDRLLTRGR